MALGKMDVDHRLAQVGMTQQQLDGAQISALLQQMSREAMPQCVRMERLSGQLERPTS